MTTTAVAVKEAPTARNRKPKAAAGDKLVLSREEAARKLGLSVPSIDRAIARGELVATRVGRRVLVPIADVERYGNAQQRKLWEKSRA